MILKGKNILLVFGAFFLLILCFSCKNNIENYYPLNENDSLYYMDLIDSTSSILYDYQNPNYCYASLKASNSFEYVLDGKETYDLIKIFDNIPLSVIEDSTLEDELNDKMISAIYLEVSYKYVGSKSNDNDGVGHFYILQDGILIFEDNRFLLKFCSQKNKVNYILFKNKILGKDVQII